GQHSAGGRAGGGSPAPRAGPLDQRLLVRVASGRRAAADHREDQPGGEPTVQPRHGRLLRPRETHPPGRPFGVSTRSPILGSSSGLSRLIGFSPTRLKLATAYFA